MPAGQEACPLDEELAALRYAVHLLGWDKITNTDAAAALRDGSPWHEEPRAHLDIGVGCVVKAVGRDRDYRSGVVERAEDNGNFRIQWEAAGASPSEPFDKAHKAPLRGP